MIMSYVCEKIFKMSQKYDEKSWNTFLVLWHLKIEITRDGTYPKHNFAKFAVHIQALFGLKTLTLITGSN